MGALASGGGADSGAQPRLVSVLPFCPPLSAILTIRHVATRDDRNTREVYDLLYFGFIDAWSWFDIFAHTEGIEYNPLVSDPHDKVMFEACNNIFAGDGIHGSKWETHFQVSS